MSQKNPSDLQERVAAWHRRRFPEATRELVTLKLAEETGEVASAINGEIGRNSSTGRGIVWEEAADVAVCLLVLMGRWYPHLNLLDEVEKKLAILSDPKSGHRAALVE